MCSSLQLKFSFREALKQNDHVILSSVIRRYSGSKQIQRLLSEERFNGFTALQQACLQQNMSMVSLLLESGADLEQRGKHGWTALHAAAFSCKETVPIIVLLLNSCADVVAKDDHGCLPVDLASNDVIRGLVLDKMEERGNDRLVQLYRKLDESKHNAITDGRSSKFPPNLSAEQCSKQDDNDDYNYCQYRQRLMCVQSKNQQERTQLNRRTVTWGYKSKRDSGVFSNDSDTHSIL